MLGLHQTHVFWCEVQTSNALLMYLPCERAAFSRKFITLVYIMQSINNDNLEIYALSFNSLTINFFQKNIFPVV